MDPHQKGFLLQDQCELEGWEEEEVDQEDLPRVKGTVMVHLHPAEKLCHPEEMIIFPEKITTTETITLTEITRALEMQEIMVHHQGTRIVPVNIPIQVAVMIMDREAIVIAMDMVDVRHVTIMIAQVVAPTETLMMAMVTHEAPHLHEGRHHLTVEVAVTMTTATAQGMDMVEAVITTAEVILTRVAAMIVLVGKIEAQVFQWKEAILHAIHTAAQAAEELVDQGVEEIALTGAVAEADTKTELNISWTKKPLLS